MNGRPRDAINTDLDAAVTTSGTGAGTASFTGPVERLLIGGQEFSLDHVCAFET